MNPHRALSLVIAGLLAPSISAQLVQLERFAPSGAVEREGFGRVALSGDFALVGAGTLPVGRTPGSTYVYERRPNGRWRQVAQLFGSSTAAESYFGSSVAIDGPRAVVGAFGDADLGPLTGAAYVFERDSIGRWNEVARLTASDGVAYQVFGAQVALSAERILVSAILDNQQAPWAGAVYVFERNGLGSWSQTAKLMASDARSTDELGTAVSLDGGRALIGAQTDQAGYETGSAYVFERQPDGSWTETAKLANPVPTGGEFFGCDVALAGERALVGAYLDSAPLYLAGTAYLFERDSAGAWQLVTELRPEDFEDGKNFGVSVALSGERALVGAYERDAAGSSYVFERSREGVWKQRAKLTASDPAPGAAFGESVALWNERVLIGAFKANQGMGAAYLFETARVRRR